MFELLLRKIVFKNLTREEQEIALLLKEKYRMYLIAETLISFIILTPYYIFVTISLYLLYSANSMLKDNILLYLSIFLCCISYVLLVRIKFKENIFILRHKIATALYVRFYVTKGEAISKKDFKMIKEQDNRLYYLIMKQETQGYCYAICFQLLKVLKKGHIKFIAVKEIKSNTTIIEEYTMHVLYVNNDWCFDTFSQRQYPLNYVMQCEKAKIYKSFYPEDVECTYEEFRDKHAPSLEKWCSKNDCFQHWRG